MIYWMLITHSVFICKRAYMLHLGWYGISVYIRFYLSGAVFYAVEKAAAVFSLKLDTGHKLLCPWIDNICDESLALFPPTPPPVLVENYYECFSSLLRLLALPRILCFSLEMMKKRSPQLEQFLSEPSSSSVVLKGRFVLTEDSTIKDLDDAFQDADTYYQVIFFFIYVWRCCENFLYMFYTWDACWNRIRSELHV